MANRSFDYIIVGGGSSGCVIANRLTENEAVNVLLLEAGGKDSHPYIHMPVGFSKLTAGPRTWGFNTVPQKFANNRESRNLVRLQFHEHQPSYLIRKPILSAPPNPRI